MDCWSVTGNIKSISWKMVQTTSKLNFTVDKNWTTEYESTIWLHCMVQLYLRTLLMLGPSLQLSTIASFWYFAIVAKVSLLWFVNLNLRVLTQNNTLYVRRSTLPSCAARMLHWLDWPPYFLWHGVKQYSACILLVKLPREISYGTPIESVA